MRFVGPFLLAVLLLPTVAYASLVNINTADAALLDSLPGIGLTKANAIIDYRTQNGPFVVIEDIKKVTGIGDATFANIQVLISVTEEAPPADPPPPAEPPPTPVDIPAPIETASSTRPAPLININTADAALLDSLPGIGPSKAAAIVDYRTQHGLFATIEDIQNVSGIGPATFANIQALITVGDAAPPPEQEPATGSAPATQSSSSSGQPSSSLININTADAALLDLLPGIGPAKAAAIVDYRTQNGPFAAIEDIQNVSGIGPSTFLNIKALITVGAVSAAVRPTPVPPPVPPPVPKPPVQPSTTTASYQRVKAVEPISSTKANIQAHDDAVIAPAAATNLAAAGAAIAPPTGAAGEAAQGGRMFGSTLVMALLGLVVVIAGGMFILL